MEPPTLAVLLTMLVMIVGRQVGPPWLAKRVQARRMARRTAIWLIAILTIVPYVLLFLLMIAMDPGFWWIALLLFIASWPLIALPMILVIHTTTEPKL